MESLRAALAAVNDSVLAYDKNYVADYLGWTDLVVEVPAPAELNQQGSAEVPHAPPDESVSKASRAGFDSQVSFSLMYLVHLK